MDNHHLNQNQNDPEDNKKMLLAVVLSMLVIVGWSIMFEQPRIQEHVEAQKQQQETVTETVKAETNKPLNKQDVIAQTQAQEKRITITTPSLKGSLTTKGARLDDLTMLKYREELDMDSPNIELLAPVGTKSPYYAEFGWVGQNLALPDGNAVWNTNDTELTPNTPVTLTWDNGKGLSFKRVYTIDENYMLTVTQSVTNTGNGTVSISPYGLVSRTGDPEIEGFYILHEGMIAVTGEELKETTYDDIKDNKKEEYQATGGWAGMTDKYWLTALVPNQDDPFTIRYIASNRGTEPLFQTDFMGASKTIAVGQTVSNTTLLFAGAKETVLLDTYAEQYNIPSFDKAVDFGMLYFLTKPLFNLLHYLFESLGNFGWAIIVLTLIIRIVLFPLTNKAYKSTSRMKLLQPEMEAIKKSCGDDRQRLSQEMMKLYQKEGVNPVSGCFPMLIQIPIFFALYKVFYVSIEMRHAPFYGYLQDLSAPDPLGLLTLFGLIDWNVPDWLSFVNIGVLPILMGLSMWLQQRLNPAPTDPTQKMVFQILPPLFTFLLASFPAGLVLYWTWSNLLSIAQQWFIMKRMGVAIGGGREQ